VIGIINEIFDMFARFGSGRYGEDLSLENHMLQTAASAELLGAPEHVVVAALLHDIGYFLRADSKTSIEEGRNIEHEALGAAWLVKWFPEEVAAPVALHVRAKRYLCAVEPGYFACLSNASRLSLATQGGIMSEAEAAVFVREPGFVDAVMLRRCDDAGKDAFIQPRSLEAYRGLLVGALRSI